GALPLVCARSGYLVDFDFDRAMAIAEARGLRVWFKPRLGAWLEEGERIGWADGDAEDWTGRLAACIETSTTRSVDYDVVFRIRLLADMGVKALSPGVNDPTTARLALHQLRLVLGLLPTIGPRWVVADRSGVPRVAAEILDEAHSLSVAF